MIHVDVDLFFRWLCGSLIKWNVCLLMCFLSLALSLYPLSLLCMWDFRLFQMLFGYTTLPGRYTTNFISRTVVFYRESVISDWRPSQTYKYLKTYTQPWTGWAIKIECQSIPYAKVFLSTLQQFSNRGKEHNPPIHIFNDSILCLCLPVGFIVLCKYTTIPLHFAILLLKL